MLYIMANMPDHVVAVEAVGKVTGEDYERVLVPAIDDRLKGHQKISLLYHVGPDFSGLTAGAMWDDAKVGMRHITAFEKVAVVSDIDWIVGAVKIFSFVIPAIVRTFRNASLDEAKAWVSS
jgi:hypothetical protein